MHCRQKRFLKFLREKKKFKSLWVIFLCCQVGNQSGALFYIKKRKKPQKQNLLMNIGDCWVIRELCERQTLPSGQQQRFQQAAGDFWIAFLNCTTFPWDPQGGAKHPTTPNPLSWWFPSPASPSDEEVFVHAGFGGKEWSGRSGSCPVMVSVWFGISLLLLQIFLISAVFPARCWEFQMIFLHVQIPCCVWPGSGVYLSAGSTCREQLHFPFCCAGKYPSDLFFLINITQMGGGKIHMENAAVFIYTAQCSNF